MASKDAPAPDIMNVKEIIEFAFGDFEKNTVNFKLVQTVLFLIARQLRLLERRVIVEVGPLTVLPSDSTLSVTEVKIHAAQKTKVKDRDGAGGPRPTVPGARKGGMTREKIEGGSARDDAGIGGKGKKSGRGTKYSSLDKTSTDKTTSSGEKTSTDRTTTSVEKTSTDKTTSSGEKTSTDRTTSSGEKTSTDKTTSSGEKTSTDKTTSSGEKTSTDKSTSSGEKTSTDRTTTSGGKTSNDKTTSSGEKTSTDRTTSSGGKTSTDKTTSSGEKTSTDRITTSGEKTTSTDKTSTSTDKPPSKTTSSDRTTTSTPSSKDATRRQKRTDSFEEPTKTPTPMASVSSIHHEKLLIVKKVPSSEARSREPLQGHRGSPQISVVTQEQFQQLADAVRRLEKKFLPIGTPGFPEHAELMEELRKGASLTEAMAALQLSARLEATEKTLGRLISMITELALQTPGIELDSATRDLLGVSETRQRDPESNELLEGASEGGRSGKNSRGIKSLAAPSSETAFAMSESAETGVAQLTPAVVPLMGNEQEVAESALDRRFVTSSELHDGASEMYNEVMKKMKTITTRTSTTAENAYKLAMKLEARLDAAIFDNSRMVNVENLVKQYAEQINALDTGLSSQMTNYQEQLTQMQHDLEVGLDNMAEVLGSSGGDIEAMSELHSRFTNFQTDLEISACQQKELKDALNSTAYDLENLWREIEILRDTKSDRDEVADALRDKAGIFELNGLVSIQQFEAVRGDFQKRIRAAYDKFNNQEHIWQKAIDDMVKVLNEKADLIQVHSLRDEIDKYFNMIKARMQIIADIVGEPKSAIVSKKVFRDTICISCGSPAHMDLEEPCKVPALSKFPSARQPAEGAEAESQYKEGGDYRPCYPNLPITHARDPRSHICKRYCGGSHTLVTDGLSKGLVVKQATRTTNVAPGTDGKLYLVDDQTIKKPCLQCNRPPSPIVQPDPEPQKQTPVMDNDDYGNIPQTPSAYDISYN